MLSVKGNSFVIIILNDLAWVPVYRNTVLHLSYVLDI